MIIGRIGASEPDVRWKFHLSAQTDALDFTKNAEMLARSFAILRGIARQISPTIAIGRGNFRALSEVFAEHFMRLTQTGT
jgi:hypothetical protein